MKFLKVLTIPRFSFPRKPIVFAIAAIFFLNPAPGAWSNRAFSEDMTQSLPSVAPTDVTYSGAFSKVIDFKVPKQRGLEPLIGLKYRSSFADNYGPESVVGVGWRLGGLSSIQRANFRRAVPRFNSDDIWLLDGKELVPCGEYVEAGCGAGGTHASRVENYLRIVKEAEDNIWEITARNGTKFIYKPLGTWAVDETVPLTGDAQDQMLSEFRYLLAEKVNTLGQSVTYDYICGADLDCQVSQISYEIGQIKFYWEPRADETSYAAGHMLGKVHNRLKTVEVRSAGQLLRAYSIEYSESPSTGRSLLMSVTEWGRDSVVSVDGVVEAGTALPSYAFEYSGNEPNPAQIADVDAETAPNVPTSCAPNCARVASGQFGKDNKVYSIHTGVNGYVTTEDPRRNFGTVREGTVFFFIKNTHNKQKSIKTAFKSSITNEWTYYSNYGKPRNIADFDGDGLDDVLGPGAGGDLKQKYSASWSASSWSGYGGGGKRVADLNGDGLSDIYHPPGTTGTQNVQFFLSNGKNKFENAYNNKLLPYHDSYSIVSDFNGDGTSDFLVENDGNNSYKIYYTVGETIVGGPSFSLPGGCDSDCEKPELARDLNGDNRIDLLVTSSDDDDGQKTIVYLNKGDDFVAVSQEDEIFTFDETFVAIGDVDDNGVSELINENDYPEAGFGAERWALFSKRPDLLEVFKTPLGATTLVTYEKHIPETETDLPLELFVVSSLTAYDGRKVRATTDFSYSGARWAWWERQFLGFEKIIATLPAIVGESGRPTVETTYQQDLASVGKVKQVLRLDGSGNLLEMRQETYDIQAETKPYWSRNTETLTTLYLEGVAREKRVVRQFNTFGLVEKTIHYGDTSKTGGEWVLTKWSYPNLEKYIVNLTAIEAINEGTEYDYSEGRFRRVWNYYDGANTEITQPPSVGLISQSSEWTGGDPEESHLLAVKTYDAFGNLVTEADALGNTSQYIYDSAYNLFPEEIRNPLYPSDNRQKTSVVWDKVCNVVIAETDENGAQTSHEYDPLCRKIGTVLPGGGRISYEYVDWGNPSQSYNRVRKNHPNGVGEIVEDAYFDGFGRTYLNSISDALQVAGVDPADMDQTAQHMPYVLNSIPDQLVTESMPWSFSLPANTFDDIDGDILTYSAFLSDGNTLPDWLSFDPVSVTFTGTPPQDMDEVLSIRVIAADGTGAGEDIFTVAASSPNAPVVENALEDQTVDLNTAWSFTVPVETFTDEDGDSLSYEASRSDGTPLPVWLSFDPSSRTFSTASLKSAISLKVTTSDGSSSAEEIFNVSVQIKQSKMAKKWGIRARLTRGILKLVSDTESITRRRGVNQNPMQVEIRGGNARIARFDRYAGKECTFGYLDARAERFKVVNPSGAVSYSDWVEVSEYYRRVGDCRVTN